MMIKRGKRLKTTVRTMTAVLALLALLCGTAGCTGKAETQDTVEETTVQEGSVSQETAAAPAGTASGAEPSQTAAEPETAKTTAAEPETTQPPTTEEPEICRLEDLSVCLDWVGKTVADARIPEGCIRSGGASREVPAEGKLFGGEASGTLVLADMEDGLTVRQLELALRGCAYEDAHDLLELRYGAPLDEGVEPSAQSAKGETLWAVFKGEGAEIWLANSSEEDFIRIQVY